MDFFINYGFFVDGFGSLLGSALVVFSLSGFIREFCDLRQKCGACPGGEGDLWKIWNEMKPCQFWSVTFKDRDIYYLFPNPYNSFV